MRSRAPENIARGGHCAALNFRPGVQRSRCSVRALADHRAAALLSGADLKHLISAAGLAGASAGLTQPHPNAACILVAPDGRIISSAHQRAHGSAPAEVLAVSAARDAAAGATAYLNLESGDCHGEDAAVQALIQSGVSRVVVGLRHPLRHLRNQAVRALRAAGVRTDVLGEAAATAAGLTGALIVDAASSGAAGWGAAAAVEGEADGAQAALVACLKANEGLLHRAVLGRPMSILKYAMTLDGKIATASGHAAWVSSPASRARVFEMRARSDAVIVGGNTVRRDNPSLTTRRDDGFAPWRIVMSRSLDLPEEANLWDVSSAPTIVMTQRGARRDFQRMLRSKGVEVVEFEFLTPETVGDYCTELGFLQVFWECGGMLAAPAISSGVIHKVMAFVAPKIIGGDGAHCPVGELGFVEMTQAVNLIETEYQLSGPDLLVSGYLPASGGLLALQRTLSQPGAWAASEAGKTSSGAGSSSSSSSSGSGSGSSRDHGGSKVQRQKATSKSPTAAAAGHDANAGDSPRVISIRKAWDEWGALSNSSPHPIIITDDDLSSSSNGSSTSGSSSNGSSNRSSSINSSSSTTTTSTSSSFSNSSSGRGSSEATGGCSSCSVWPSVEHYYQASRFAAVNHPDSCELIASICAAPSPEEAARIAHRAAHTRPELVRCDWESVQAGVLQRALRAKFTQHEGPRRMLLSTAAGGRAARLLDVSSRGASEGEGDDSIIGKERGQEQDLVGKLLEELRGHLLSKQLQGEGRSGGKADRRRRRGGEARRRQLVDSAGAAV